MTGNPPTKWANIWFSDPVTAEREHPGGYVVEIRTYGHKPSQSQYDLGVSEFIDAVRFARDSDVDRLTVSGSVPLQWAGRKDGDEVKRASERSEVGTK